MNNNALIEIYNNLKNGMIYADYLSNVRFPCFWYVLTYDRIKNLFFWRNFGESANKATLKDLAWIIEQIFDTTPEAFAEKYHCVDRATYNAF